MSQPRDLTAKRSHSQKISQTRGLTAKRSHSQEIPQPRDLTAKLRCHIFHFQVLRDVSHENFDFTFSTFTFQGGLALKLRFHIFNFHFFREVSHESFVFTSSTFTFSGRSRTKASFSHLQLSDFEGGLARKLHFHIFNFQILRGVSSLARKRLPFHIFHFHFFREISHESFVFTSSTFRF